MSRLLAALISVSGLALSSGPEGYVFPGESETQILIRVHVWGQVHSPGTKEVPVGSDLLVALSEAGGPTVDADLGDVRIFQGVSDPVVCQTYDLGDFLEGLSSIPPPVLGPGATVYVDRSSSDWWKEALDIFYKALVTANLVWIMLER